MNEYTYTFPMTHTVSSSSSVPIYGPGPTWAEAMRGSEIARDKATRDLLGIDIHPITKKGSPMTSAKTAPRLAVGYSNPSTHERARDESNLFSTDCQQTIDGWVGQVLVLGVPVWQSAPYPEHSLTDTPDAHDQALAGARDYVINAIRVLFSAPTNGNPVGFTPAPTTTGA